MSFTALPQDEDLAAGSNPPGTCTVDVMVEGLLTAKRDFQVRPPSVAAIICEPRTLRALRQRFGAAGEGLESSLCGVPVCTEATAFGCRARLLEMAAIGKRAVFVDTEGTVEEVDLPGL